MTALVFVAPNIAKVTHPDPTHIIDIYETPPPPPVPEPDEPKPEVARDSLIVVPDPITPVIDTTPVVRTTTELPIAPPVIDLGTPKGNADQGTVIDPPKPLPFLGASVDSRYARYLQPDYPGPEMRLGRDGYVSVKVKIGVDGRVLAVERVSATSDAFFEATRKQALAKWRFKPATRGGIPEESWKTMNVRFEMKS